MKIKVLTPSKKAMNNKNNYKPQILTSNYVKQLNNKISYNNIQSTNRTEIGKKELVLKRTKF